MSTPGNKPPPSGSDAPFGGDDDFGELDAFGPSNEPSNPFDGSQTRIASAESVSRKSSLRVDQERARALNISMATTLIEPLPSSKVVFVELPNGNPAILSKSVTIIGRAAGVADVVLDDDGVSRQHAAIVYARGEFFLEDLRSSNGTFVDGERISVVQLSPGSAFTLGRHACRFCVRER